jgi:hypothetical protein
MFWNRLKRGQRGQSAVETAIVMPLNVFIILAIIQNGLIAQARVMAKYAAYRAVRVGVMNNASTTMMTNAALVTLFPVLAFPTSAGGPAVFPNLQDPASLAKETIEAVIFNAALGSTFLKPVNVVICGPLSGAGQWGVGNVTQDKFPAYSSSGSGATGSANQVDFDDPRASTEWGNSISATNIGATNYGAFTQTKLRIQVQFKYPMVIPFANWIISLAYLGQDLPDVMRMQTSPNPLPIPSDLNTSEFVALLAANKAGSYLAPINVSYAMRMQSNFYLGQAALPSANNCFHYTGA